MASVPKKSPRVPGQSGMAGIEKYRPYLTQFPLTLAQRSWPDARIENAPMWCSVDLRDGNQALVNPMNLDQKLEMFRLLVSLGFKEIEIGFPSAAQVEFDFTRLLIEQKLIPQDVTPQILTQARAHLIDRSFEALQGARRAIVHLYNSTSELQRRVVFRSDRKGIIDIAVEGTRRIKELASRTETQVVFEYSPESFTGTEIEFSKEICEAVMDVWQPTPERKMILNLPATVEMATPNVYADQIEWFAKNTKNRDCYILSLHTHNDRGTGIAATELGLLAGAQRVEGTLFGNGERTGNVDICTVALNLFSQGIDPKLDLSDIEGVRAVAERCTEIPVNERHPYAGKLVFTAFSGSHQDAINKGMRARKESKNSLWEVPYLAVDPSDLGRSYEAIIRINSQSGKGGVAYLMQSEFGCDLPREMHPEFSTVIQGISDKSGVEVLPQVIWDAFQKEYLEAVAPYKFINFKATSVNGDDEVVECVLNIEREGKPLELKGVGNGPIDACKQALISSGCPLFHLKHFMQHARSAGSDAEAVSYIQVELASSVASLSPAESSSCPRSVSRCRFGVGIHSNIEKASIKALLSAVNRMLA